MTRQSHVPDSHEIWLDDIEYRHEFGSETAKLEMAAALLRAREGMSLTQSRLANLAGTSQAYIAKLESGGANPTIGNVGRLFASMWLKPRIEHTLLEPSKFIESVVLNNLGASEASFDLSRFNARPSATEAIPDIITRPTGEVFKDLMDKGLLVVVWRYDNPTASWSSYHPTAPAELNDLMYVSTGDIVWIEVTEETQFHDENLYKGQNLISLKNGAMARC